MNAFFPLYPIYYILKWFKNILSQFCFPMTFALATLLLFSPISLYVQGVVTTTWGNKLFFYFSEGYVVVCF